MSVARGLAYMVDVCALALATRHSTPTTANIFIAAILLSSCIVLQVSALLISLWRVGGKFWRFDCVDARSCRFANLNFSAPVLWWLHRCRQADSTKLPGEHSAYPLQRCNTDCYCDLWMPWEPQHSLAADVRLRLPCLTESHANNAMSSFGCKSYCS